MDLARMRLLNASLGEAKLSEAEAEAVAAHLLANVSQASLICRFRPNVSDRGTPSDEALTQTDTKLK